ncbi:MAG: ribosome biogenesis protein [Candidatus Woesearchaeota archaeon]|nr:MAG: ribosome biogenesis protein [Candidatus Woesearchaeota archaeon]
MSNKIFYCKTCDIFTLKQNCTNCNKNTLTTKPAKFSLEDKHGIYRRRYKKER